MLDGRLLLDLRCPSRGVWFYLLTTGPGLAAVLGILFWGRQETKYHSAILVALAICFSLPGVQSIQERVQVDHSTVRTRYLGFWRVRRLPKVVKFRPSLVRRRHDGIARSLLRAPEGIEIVDGATGRVITEIGFDLLAGMPDPEYRKLLKSLNHAVTQRFSREMRP
jgi:hypothetical protein